MLIHCRVLLFKFRENQILFANTSMSSSSISQEPEDREPEAKKYRCVECGTKTDTYVCCGRCRYKICHQCVSEMNVCRYLYCENSICSLCESISRFCGSMCYKDYMNRYYDYIRYSAYMQYYSFYYYSYFNN